MIPKRALAVLLAASLTCCVSSTGAGLGEPAPALSRGQLWATWNRLRGDEYPLDALDRSLAFGERINCDARPLIAYKGHSVRYRGTVWVNPVTRTIPSRCSTPASYMN